MFCLTIREPADLAYTFISFLIAPANWYRKESSLQDVNKLSFSTLFSAIVCLGKMTSDKLIGKESGRFPIAEVVPRKI